MPIPPLWVGACAGLTSWGVLRGKGNWEVPRKGPHYPHFLLRRTLQGRVFLPAPSEAGGQQGAPPGHTGRGGTSAKIWSPGLSGSGP